VVGCSLIPVHLDPWSWKLAYCPVLTPQEDGDDDDDHDSIARDEGSQITVEKHSTNIDYSSNLPSTPTAAPSSPVHNININLALIETLPEERAKKHKPPNDCHLLIW
jgi:hypothetical protein